MRSNQGFSSILLMLAIVVAIAAVAIALLIDSSGLSLEQTTRQEITNREIMEMSQEPISEEGDLETIEQELKDTQIGDIEDEFDELNDAASSL